MIMPKSHLTYRPDIDGLRALAVLAVVGFHAFPELFPGGFIGVDIFFVISGYLITGILLDNIHQGKFSIVDFYARRIRRIFPALLSILLACLVAGWLVFLTDEYKTLGKNIVASSLFVSNFFLWTQVSYFDTSAEFKPLLHLWSLAVEEQFYIIWPATLYLLSKKKNLLLYGTTAILLVSFSSSISHLNSVASRFYLPNNRFWELLIGALLTIKFQTGIYDRIPAWSKSLAGLMLILASVFALDKHSVFPGWLALPPTLGAFLLISAGEHNWINRKIFSAGIAVFIGLISYPLYLWHWPLLAFAKVLKGSDVSWQIRTGCVAMSFFLAWTTYHLVERPLRSAHTWKVPALIVVALLLGCIGYLGAQGMIKPRSASYGLELILKEIDEWEFPRSEQDITFEGQHFLAQGKQTNVALFIGDSNMAMYAARINRLVAADTTHAGKGAVFATLGGCMPVPGVGRLDTPTCLPLMRSTYRYALENQSVSTVVIGALWANYHYESQSFYQQGSVTFPLQQHEEMAYAALEKTIHDLVGSGKKVYVILNIPWSQYLDPRSLFKRSSADFQFSVTTTGGIERKSLDNIEGVNHQLSLLAERAGATVINPVDHLCNSQRCPLFTDEGQLIYKDSGHLTVRYVSNFADYLDQTMK
jgi:peptidoglycan/LPS O-acetylase OafA/YrhL